MIVDGLIEMFNKYLMYIIKTLILILKYEIREKFL